ncbi:MAG: hypothetical protein IJ888_09815 [Prevotella sp.]|nr:hypothetical protein [Prevotella sp.]
MKREYMKPAMMVVKIGQQCNLLAGSATIESVTGGTETGIDYGGGSSGPALGREFDELWEYE